MAGESGVSAGYDISASSSTSATSGNKVSTGPTTFGSVVFGPRGSATDWIPLIVLGLILAFLFFKKR
jgi:hypothetical protein